MLVYPFIAGQKKLTSLLRVGSNSSSDQQTVTLPLDIREGDLIICANQAWNTSSTAAAPPSGFTSMMTWHLSAVLSGVTRYSRTCVSRKIAAGTEGGTTLTGMSLTGSVNPGAALGVVVFRGNKKITSVSAAQDFDGVGTTGGSAISRNVDAADGDEPMLVVSYVQNLGATFSSVNQRLMTPSADDELVFGSNNMALRWLFYGANETPEDNLLSMQAWSGTRMLSNCYIELGID